MKIKELLEKIKSYEFKDEHGNLLEYCKDYQDLIKILKDRSPSECKCTCKH